MLSGHQQCTVGAISSTPYHCGSCCSINVLLPLLLFLKAGLMRKRIASINEAPIQPSERRIAVDPPAAAAVNTWLAQQGLSGGAEFPFGGGTEKCY
jgi:hypothetical protein